MVLGAPLTGVGPRYPAAPWRSTLLFRSPLTVVTVLAIPFNIVGPPFGMNVAGIPLAESPHAFWLIVLWVGRITGGAAWLALRRR